MMAIDRKEYSKKSELTGLPETEFSMAHEIAQKNASLPVSEGGLGLPPNNTAIDRARARRNEYKFNSIRYRRYSLYGNGR